MKIKLFCSMCLLILAIAVPNTLFAQYGDQRFNLSGFVEVLYQQFDFEQEENNIVKDTLKDKPHFALNNLNLYMNFNVDENWLGNVNYVRDRSLEGYAGRSERNVRIRNRVRVLEYGLINFVPARHGIR